MQETQPMGASLCPLSDLFSHLLKWWSHHMVIVKWSRFPYTSFRAVTVESLSELSGTHSSSQSELWEEKANKSAGGCFEPSRAACEWEQGEFQLRCGVWWHKVVVLHLLPKSWVILSPNGGPWEVLYWESDKIWLPSREALRVEIEKERTKSGKKRGDGTPVSEAEQRWPDWMWGPGMQQGHNCSEILGLYDQTGGIVILPKYCPQSSGFIPHGVWTVGASG